MEKSRSKKIKRFAAAFLAAAIVLAALIIWTAKDGGFSDFSGTLGNAGGQQGAEDGLNIYFIDVGQGDCILITCGGMSMLVDAGERAYAENVAVFLNSKGTGVLDYVVATHPHSDHIGALPYIIDTFGAKRVVMPVIPQNLNPDTYIYKQILEAASSSEIIAASCGEEFMLGDARVRVVAPVSGSAEDLNNLSVVLRIDYKNASALLTGDAAFSEELEILGSGQNIDCDLLKAGHHGSAGSTGSQFLEAVSPDICVISVGRDNDFGHPAGSTLGRIAKYTDRVYRTDRCGNITAHSDGDGFAVTY